MKLTVSGSGAQGERTSPTSYFADFRRGDTNTTLGTDWFDTFSISATVSITENGLQAGINCSVAGATFGSVGSNAVSRTTHIPIPVDHYAILQKSLTRTQFAELLMGAIGGAGVTGNVGPCVLAGPGNEYLFAMRQDGGSDLYCNLSDYLGGPRTLIANVTTWVAGDTMRIEATPGATATAITLKKNGTTVGTFSDSNAARSISGLFGIHFFGWNARTITVRTFNGGFV